MESLSVTVKGLQIFQHISSKRSWHLIDRSTKVRFEALAALYAEHCEDQAL